MIVSAWAKVFEKSPGFAGQPTQRWQWFDTTGQYEQRLYPGVWLAPTAICPPPGMGFASDACCVQQR
jgi:hypothetical protein